MSETYVTAHRAGQIAGCDVIVIMKAVRTKALVARKVDRSTILIALSDLRAWQKGSETPIDPVLLYDAAKGLRRYRP